jgi:hypothetical protein
MSNPNRKETAVKYYQFNQTASIDDPDGIRRHIQRGQVLAEGDIEPGCLASMLFTGQASLTAAAPTPLPWVLERQERERPRASRMQTRQAPLSLQS